MYYTSVNSAEHNLSLTFCKKIQGKTFSDEEIKEHYGKHDVAIAIRNNAMYIYAQNKKDVPTLKRIGTKWVKQYNEEIIANNK